MLGDDGRVNNRPQVLWWCHEIITAKNFLWSGDTVAVVMLQCNASLTCVCGAVSEPAAATSPVTGVQSYHLIMVIRDYASGLCIYCMSHRYFSRDSLHLHKTTFGKQHAALCQQLPHVSQVYHASRMSVFY